MRISNVEIKILSQQYLWRSEPEASFAPVHFGEMMMYKNIIFDFGGVLIDWDPNAVYRSYFRTEEEMILFYQETSIFESNREMDRGLAFDIALQALAEKFPHYHEPIWFWRDRWPRMIKGAITETVAVLENLYYRGYSLYGLTNWSAETFPYAFKKYSFFKYFKDIVISGKEQVIKPHQQIYQILLERNHLKPAESIFIDDSIENVEAARVLGLEGIHFKTSKHLVDKLNLLLL